MDDINKQPEWVDKGKTIKELIQELNSFENQDIKVEISLDGGLTHFPISLVGKSGEICLLMNFENES